MYQIQIYTDANGKHRWRMLAGDNIIAACTDAYDSQEAVLIALADLSMEIPQCPIVSEGGERHFRRHSDEYVTVTIPRSAARRLNQAYNLASMPGYNKDAGAVIRSRSEHAENVANALRNFLSK